MPETTAYILDADYQIGDEVTVRLFCVDDDGDPFIATDTSFEPYFYVIPEQDEDTIQAVQDRIAQLVVDDDGEQVPVDRVKRVERRDGKETVTALQVYAQIPPHVPKLREAVLDWEPVVETREYDIPFYKRYLIDHQLFPTEPVVMTGERAASDPPTLRLDAPPEPGGDGRDYRFSTLAFDLEVYDDEIIMASLYADDYEKVLVTYDDGWNADYVDVVEDEAALLQRLMAIVEERDPDIVTGYNTDEFDFEVLRERAQAHGMELVMGRTEERMKFNRRGRFAGATLEGRVHLDLYAFVENIVSMGMRSETLSLDAVAEELLGENKEDVSWEEIKEYWQEKKELDLLATYALRDAELAHKLGESLIPQILSLSALTGLPPFDVCRHTYGQLVEHYMLMRARARDIVAPNRPTGDERGKRYSQGGYAGGFVYEPEKGLHDNIALFDFRSLYPTIIVSHNISPDVVDVDGCQDELEVEIEEANETFTFCQDEPGFIPDILEDLVRERYELKGELDELDPDAQAYRDVDNRQNALKILSNAFYGYMGYAGARWYSLPCAEATTALGRKYIREAIETAEEMGFEIVYGDTDSVFIKGDDVRERADAFQEEVNDSLPAFMELEFEGFYPRGLFTYTQGGGGAKKKYALLGEDGSVKITGFEQVRRDWSQVAKDTQEEVIRLVLEDQVEEAVERVKDMIQELKDGNVDLERLKIHTTLNKKPENYESKAPHTEAAKRAIERGTDVSPGDTVAYVITSGRGSISDRAELVQYAEDYDPDYYVEKQIIPVALRVLKVLGYTENQLLGKGKQTGLGSFG